MDLWVVAVAAGAGYAVKANYFKNSSARLRERSFESFSLDYFHSQSQSWNLLQRIREQTCPFCRLGVCKHSATDESLGRDFIGVASSSATKGEIQLQSHRPYGRGYFFYLSSELLPDSIEREVSSFRRLTADRQLGNGSRGYINNLDSSDSILTPELYGGDIGFEENEYASLPSSSIEMAQLSPIGSWIMRGSHDFGQEMPSEKEKGSLMLTRKQMQYFDMGQYRRLSRSGRRVTGGLFYSQGSYDRMLLFFLGITVGIVSHVAANKREVDYLNELLKQNENLVQDLNEELVSEGSSFQGKTEKPSNSASSEVSTKKESGKSIKFYGREPDDEKAANSEAMSKIEAELEAELERLELNMKSSSLERMLDLIEMDPNFELDVKGDLSPDEGHKKPDDLSDSDDDASGSSTNPIDTANYAVSHKELSLRLHEVIQSRLVVRIMELEAALENSQKRLHALESDSTSPKMDLHGEVESSSIQQSPSFTGEGNGVHYQFATSGKADRLNTRTTVFS
ncbi:PREDICTED: uncharacterized protein LOC105121650 isoform X2 [Populus euphratica]|uniref:Uncharacterized protein LOC105121650 isoform X1 n=1 Tax=Populus euphratica TaxID=75702 RepID=A0AAJ6XH13_POPEU|nr:PREDICTED: uncharacterized protein LOC105121650 isoform X1 [Populus euphratica]XP_011018689.1 PREDICTED: uncharacterized protein LOC105121650 isoform X2 [Populus euphratica]